MQLAYVLTGKGPDAAARYLRGLRLSVASLRRFHPEATVHCFCDRPMSRAVARAADDGLAIDRVVECPEAGGGPVHRSRFLKTTLRDRLVGRFLYLDVDSVVAGPLDAIFGCRRPIGLTVDAFFPGAVGRFPAWLAPHYRRLGWSPTATYYSGGILSVADTEATRRLFHAWHGRWRQTVAIGLVMDQPALNRAIAEVGPELEVFPESYNVLVGCDDRVLPADARVVSFLASREGPMLARYESALAGLDDAEATAAALDALTAAGAALPRRARPWPAEWSRRLRELLVRAGARHGLCDASKQ